MATVVEPETDDTLMTDYIIQRMTIHRGLRAEAMTCLERRARNYYLADDTLVLMVPPVDEPTIPEPRQHVRGCMDRGVVEGATIPRGGEGILAPLMSLTLNGMFFCYTARFGSFFGGFGRAGGGQGMHELFRVSSHLEVVILLDRRASHQHLHTDNSQRCSVSAYMHFLQYRDVQFILLKNTGCPIIIIVANPPTRQMWWTSLSTVDSFGNLSFWNSCLMLSGDTDFISTFLKLFFVLMSIFQHPNGDISMIGADGTGEEALKRENVDVVIKDEGRQMLSWGRRWKGRPRERVKQREGYTQEGFGYLGREMVLKEVAVNLKRCELLGLYEESDKLRTVGDGAFKAAERRDVLEFAEDEESATRERHLMEYCIIRMGIVLAAVRSGGGKRVHQRDGQSIFMVVHSVSYFRREATDRRMERAALVEDGADGVEFCTQAGKL
ncbi:hypothetical protein EDD18DRAFT_1112182 [Armillaria luteobubalina]|uniref:Uncharacterized protein n=1 Tax=Armillaria luteobubalina TaxID=153913 RepID=A0AA39PI24_9AGAR|nr:hypothetical protein EDD18DRAFT_1112182 [Armillaria luteobubalina]